MSQDTFPFADGVEAVPYTDEPERNRKAILVAGGVAAALVVAAGGYFLLGGGDDATEAAFVPHKTVRPVAVAPKTVTKPAKKLPAAYKERLGRDPFKALYVVPVEVPAAAAAPTQAPAPATAPAATDTSGGTSGTQVGTSRYTLKLVSISKPSPEVRFTTWKVGTDSKTVIPAQRFGKYGEIVVLAFAKNASGVVDKAIIQVGDDSPIDVKVGESVSVL